MSSRKRLCACVSAMICGFGIEGGERRMGQRLERMHGRGTAVPHRRVAIAEQLVDHDEGLVADDLVAEDRVHGPDRVPERLSVLKVLRVQNDHCACKTTHGTARTVRCHTTRGRARTVRCQTTRGRARTVRCQKTRARARTVSGHETTPWGGLSRPGTYCGHASAWAPSPGPSAPS